MEKLENEDKIYHMRKYVNMIIVNGLYISVSINICKYEIQDFFVLRNKLLFKYYTHTNKIITWKKIAFFKWTSVRR